jgi:hypothetical protein
MGLFHDPISFTLLKGEIKCAIHSFRFRRGPKRFFGSLQFVLV